MSMRLIVRDSNEGERVTEDGREHKALLDTGNSVGDGTCFSGAFTFQILGIFILFEGKL